MSNNKVISKTLIFWLITLFEDKMTDTLNFQTSYVYGSSYAKRLLKM